MGLGSGIHSKCVSMIDGVLLKELWVSHYEVNTKCSSWVYERLFNEITGDKFCQSKVNGFIIHHIGKTEVS